MKSLYQELIRLPSSQMDEIRIIESYRESKKNRRRGVLEEAISGTRSIKEALLSVEPKDGQVAKLFPRKKDEDKNKIVRELEVLVGNLDGLKADGFLAFDNFFNCAVLGSTGIYAISATLGYIFEGLPPSEEKRLVVENIIHGTRGSNMLLCTFILAPYVHFTRTKSLPIKEAQYIDRRIKALYSTP